MSDEKVPHVVDSQCCGKDFEKLFNIFNKTRSTNCLGDEDHDEYEDDESSDSGSESSDETSDISSDSGSESSDETSDISSDSGSESSDETSDISSDSGKQIMTTLHLLSKSQNSLTEAFIRLLNV
jgi:hypothetical protein